MYWILLRKCWWMIPLIGLLIYVVTLKVQVSIRDKTIKAQAASILEASLEAKKLKRDLDVQNQAVDLLDQKGKEQAAKLDTAIARVNAMKPVTQVIIREIYTDKAKDANQLLLNALSD